MNKNELIREIYRVNQKKTRLRDRISIEVNFSRFFEVDIYSILLKEFTKKDLKSKDLSVGIYKNNVDYKDIYRILLYKDSWGIGVIGKKEYLAITAFFYWISKYIPSLLESLIKDLRKKEYTTRQIIYFLRNAQITAKDICGYLDEYPSKVYRLLKSFKEFEINRRREEKEYLFQLRIGKTTPKIEKNLTYVDASVEPRYRRTKAEIEAERKKNL